jgi:pimeloyl-ACP methyl ester carboxylesterase
MTHTEQRIALDDGAATTLERWGEGGPAMLCVHGMTSSRKSWERFAVRYAGTWRVFAYDQRGHGDSAGVSGPMTLHRSLLDLYNVMDAIREPVRLLIGHSWGGAVAILAGRRFDIDSVAAIDPMVRQADASWYEEFLRELKPLFARRGAQRDAYVEETFSGLGWGRIDVERKKHAVREMTAAPIEALRDQNPRDAWDLRGDLERYPKPLLLAVAGQGESIVRLEDLKAMRERGGSNTVIRVFEGQGHNLHRTAFDAFTAELDRFLARVKESPVHTGPL